MNIERRKDFQSVIAHLRQEGDRYPKAMMTGRQEVKGEATVNCGGEWGTPDTTLAMAKQVMQDEGFQSFLRRQNARAVVERVGSHYPYYRIRIRFGHVEAAV